MNFKIDKPTLWQRFFSLITRSLRHPWLILFLVVLAMLLNIPALWNGFWADDFIHRIIMLDLSPVAFHSNKIFSAYDFFPKNQTIQHTLMEIGMFPWWTGPDFHLNFLRPISSMSIWLDYQLWPNVPALMHLHSLAWYGALVAAVTYFYRRIIGVTWIAGLASLLFAIDFRHADSTAWIANRHALISVFFGILCLIAHDVWRTSGKKIYAFTAPLFLALALFSGEMALATIGFLLAYTVFLDNGRLKQRLASIVPCNELIFNWAFWRDQGAWEKLKNLFLS
jgi:hypothetical protein